MQGQLPARGVVEVKGPAEDVKRIARSEQVKRYSAKYGVVLVTNYRDFLLLGRDAQGNPLPMEGVHAGRRRSGLLAGRRRIRRRPPTNTASGSANI